MPPYREGIYLMTVLMTLLMFLLTTSAYSMSFDEIKQVALEHSVAISSQELERYALEQESYQKGKWQNPQLMGQFGTLKSGPYKGQTTEISLTQSIPLSDKYSLRREIAQEAMKSQMARTEYYKKWVTHEAVLSYWQVFIRKELFKHGRERSKRLAMIKKYLETRPHLTVRQRIEHSIIATNLLQLERDQDLKLQELKKAENSLEFWLGKKLNSEEIELEIPEKFHTIKNPQLEVQNNAELKSAKHQLKASTLDAELAQKERRPDLFIGGGYRIENVTPVNHFSYAIIGLNIPLWDTGMKRSEAAKARELRDQKLMIETERQLVLKYKNLLGQLEFSEEQVKRFPSALVKKQEKIIKEGQLGFMQGVLDVNTFLQVETQTHESVDQVYSSWMTYLENLSMLQLLAGLDLQWEAVK